jgi:hypothetical protein
MAFQVEEFTLTGSTSHTVALSAVPLNPSEVAVDPFGGPAQVYGSDYVISGQTLDFSSPTSDIRLLVDQGYDVVIRVFYEK